MFAPLAPLAHLRGETHAPALYQTESNVAPEFRTLLKEELQAETNAKKGFSRLYTLYNRLHKAEGIEVAHTVPEGAHAGQDHVARIHDGLGAPGNDHVGADLFKGFGDAPEVTHVIVHHCYHRYSYSYS